jgi:outer membrane protein TolC
MLLTLEEAIRIAKENNRAVKIAELKVEAASARERESRAAMLPSLRFDGLYKRQSDVDPFAVQLPMSPAPVVISPTVLNNYSLRIGLQQPLFTGFRLQSNTRAAQYMTQATEEERKTVETDITLNSTTAYWLLYQTIEAKKAVDENVARLTSYENDTRNLVKAGLATRNDVLKIQVQLSSARLAQIDAANDAEVAAMNLNNTLGTPPETVVHLQSFPREAVAPEGKPVERSREDVMPVLFQKALEDRTDLKALASRVESSRASVTAARGAWWPQIGLSANYLYARPNPRYMPTQDAFKSTWEVGVTMQFDIWNWGITAHQAEQAHSHMQQQELMFAQAKDNIALDVRRSQLGVDRARERVEVARAAIAQADENARSTNEKYRNGLATSSDLLDASVAVLQAQTSYTAALVEHEIAIAKLNKAIGQ